MKNSVVLFALINMISFGAFASPLKIVCSANGTLTHTIDINVTSGNKSFAQGTGTILTNNGVSALALTSNNGTKNLDCTASKNRKNVIESVNCINNYGGVTGSSTISAQLLLQKDGRHYSLFADDRFVVDVNKSELSQVLIDAKDLICSVIR